MGNRTRAAARGSDILTLGFGTTVAMWTVGYIGRLPDFQAPSAVLLTLMLLILAFGGFVSARLTTGGVLAGVRTGVLSSLLNLLILGSLLADAARGEILPSALVWLPGSLAAGAILGALGGLLGSRGAGGCEPLVGQPLFDPDGLADRAWDAAFASVAGAATLLLIVAGGVVTGQQAGLAVVDWPNSFGSNMFLYPLSRMTGGIYFEHSHRLIGSLVGFTTLVLAIQLWRVENRRWVKGLAGAALAMVIIQGILGGLRVTGHFTMSQDAAITTPSITLAVVHGVFAQLFLSTLVALFCVTTPLWRRAVAAIHPGAGIDHGLSRILVIMVIVQLMLGAVLRHVAHGLLFHITMATIVAGTALFAGMRAWGEHRGQPVIPYLGRGLMVLVTTQLVLGVLALWGTSLTTTRQAPHLLDVIFTTTHQTVGAVILTMSVMLMLWTRRLVRSQA